MRLDDKMVSFPKGTEGVSDDSKQAQGEEHVILFASFARLQDQSVTIIQEFSNLG